MKHEIRIGRPSVKLVVVTLAATLLVGAASAAAGPSGAFAVGGFQGQLSANANQNLAFSAHATPNGVVGRVSQTIVVQGSVSKLRGRVVCLAVSGNRAAVGFEVLESSGILVNPYSVGSIHSLIVRDDAEGDTFAFIFTECTAAVAVEPVFPIKHGNIVVRP